MISLGSLSESLLLGTERLSVTASLEVTHVWGGWFELAGSCDGINVF